MTESPAVNAHRLLISLCCGLLLLAPLAWTLEATSYVGVAVGVLVTALTALAFGLVVRRPLPDGLVTALLTVACLIPLVLAALLVAGPQSGGATSALVLGLPSVAVAAVLAVRITAGLHLRSGRDDIVPAAILAGISLAVCLGALAPNVHGRIAEARTRAHIVAALEGAGVLPLMPQIDGLSPTEVPTVDLESDGYAIELAADDWDRVDGPHIRIEAGPPLTEEQSAIERATCDSGARTCTQEGDDFLVVEAPQEDTRVIAIVGRTRLEAYLYDDEGELPSPAEVGRALHEAELVDWDDVVRLGPEGD